MGLQQDYNALERTARFLSGVSCFRHSQHISDLSGPSTIILSSLGVMQQRAVDADSLAAVILRRAENVEVGYPPGPVIFALVL